MSVESEEGVGTTFYFCVTLGKEAVQDDGQALAESQSALVQSCRILLVEDDETTVFSIRRLLENFGHSVAIAHNGQEALDLLAAEEFELILMDIQMPIMDGMEAVLRIRNTGPEWKQTIPIIALTAYAMPGDREKFLEAGMDDYIAKPVHVEELKKVLTRVRKNA